MLGITKIKVWATVDGFGDIKCISKDYPTLKEKEFSIPMTLTLGHSWKEGFDAWWANFQSWF